MSVIRCVLICVCDNLMFILHCFCENGMILVNKVCTIKKNNKKDIYNV